MRFAVFFVAGVLVALAVGALLALPELLRELFDIRDEEEGSGSTDDPKSG